MINTLWIPTFLKLNAVGFYFLLVKQIVYIYCECHINKILYHSMHLPKTYHSICEKNIHIVHSPVGTPEGDIVVDRILSYYIFSTRSYFGYLITCPCSFLQVCITCSKTVFIIIHSVSIDWFNFVSQIG